MQNDFRKRGNRCLIHNVELVIGRLQVSERFVNDSTGIN